MCGGLRCEINKYVRMNYNNRMPQFLRIFKIKHSLTPKSLILYFGVTWFCCLSASWAKTKSLRCHLYFQQLRAANTELL